jgi:hypothetical protein
VVGRWPAEAPTYKRFQDVTGVIGISLKIIYILGMCPVLGQNILKNIGFKGHQIISLPGVTTCLRLALCGIILCISTAGLWLPVRIVKC